jgi:hypothetical protein
MKYGRGKTIRAINAAIRAEIPGGNEALDSLELLHHVMMRQRGATREVAQLAYDRMLGVVEAMESEVRRRYEMPGVTDL